MLCNIRLTLAEVGTLKGVSRVKVLSTAEELPGHMPHKQAPTALTLQTGPAEHSIIAVTHRRSRALVASRAGTRSSLCAEGRPVQPGGNVYTVLLGAGLPLPHQVKCHQLIPPVVQVDLDEGLCALYALLERYQSAEDGVHLHSSHNTTSPGGWQAPEPEQ